MLLVNHIIPIVSHVLFAVNAWMEFLSQWMQPIKYIALMTFTSMFELGIGGNNLIFNYACKLEKFVDDKVTEDDTKDHLKNK